MIVKQTLLVLILATLLAVSGNSQTCHIANDLRTECGNYGITQQQCELKGCCWKAVGHESYNSK